MIRTHAVVAFALVVAAGCGYLGAPLVPLANVPARVTDLAAIQRGNSIFVHFIEPTKTTENYDIPKPVKLDLRIGVAPEPFSDSVWAAQSREVRDIKLDGQLATAQIPIADWIGKNALLGVKVTGANGKDAGWSNWQTVSVIAAPETPTDLKLENTVYGVHMTWNAKGSRFVILRRSGKDQPWGIVNTTDAHEWTDTSTEFDKSYEYEAQTLVDLAGGKTAESEIGAPAAITPHDVFPPAIPTGLRAIAGPNSVELTWERNTEPDLAGYRIYRAIGDGAFERIAEGGEIPGYSDTKVETGKTYRYAISAVDKTGNESQRTGPVEAVHP